MRPAVVFITSSGVAGSAVESCRARMSGRSERSYGMKGKLRPCESLPFAHPELTFCGAEAKLLHGAGVMS